MRAFALCVLCLFFATDACAHFGLVISSRSMVLTKPEAALRLDIAFAHPFAQEGMPMAKPKDVFVQSNGKKNALEVAASQYLGEAAWSADFKIPGPGVYQFAVVPEPYYEKAEDCLIVHYAKTIVGAFGYEDGWGEPLGLPVEIVPLLRPFGNYAGNVFAGVVLKDGKPLANAAVEVEFLNSGSQAKAANPYFETQLVTTDANGEFVFGIPWPGWWGFAALATADEKQEHAGKPTQVELGGILWLEFSAVPAGK